MKNIKKLLALVLALAICAAFALPALAAEEDPTYSLKMNNPQPKHEYTIFQLLKGTVLPGGTNIPTGTLGNIEWGQSIIVPEEGAVTLNGKHYASAQDYADYLSGLTTDKLDAEIKAIKDSLNNTFSSTPNPNDDGSLVWSVKGGYYAVYDTTPGEHDDTDPLSNVMAQVVGDTTITPKPNKLIPDKGVKEALDTEAEYQKIINSEVGRILDYKVTATVSVGTMNLNEEYWVALSDTMTKGHTYKEETARLVVLNTDGTEISNITLPSVNSATNDDKTITLTVDKFDLKAALKEALGDNMPTIGNVTVQLTYQAVVNEDAIEFDVVENEVTWSTSVKHDGEDMQEGTPIKTKTYIYDLSGEKISGDDNSALPGAEFTLERIFKDADGKVDESKTVKIDIYETTTDGVYYAWNNGESTKLDGLTPVEGNVIVAEGGNDKNTFIVKGLAEGWYRLTETKTPDGYNTMAALEIQIVPNQKQIEGSDPAKYELTDGCIYNYLEAKNSDIVQVVNEKGSLLPSTGGIGTTIFYVVGAVLVVGAGVLLFTKRRIKG